MPPAARLGDAHSCPGKHRGGPVNSAVVPNVLIDNRPAAVVGSICSCGCGRPDPIVAGSSTVTIGGKPAARVGDPTAHGGVVAAGSSIVIIGG